MADEQLVPLRSLRLEVFDAPGWDLVEDLRRRSA